MFGESAQKIYDFFDEYHGFCALLLFFRDVNAIV